MIAPKKKVSQFRKRRRHSTRQTLNIKRLENTYAFVKCSHCGVYKHTHRVCPHCGRYGGKQILTIKSKSKEKVMDA